MVLIAKYHDDIHLHTISCGEVRVYYKISNKNTLNKKKIIFGIELLECSTGY